MAILESLMRSLPGEREVQRAARERKGQRNQNPASRQQALGLLERTRLMSRRQVLSPVLVISDTHPPSTTPLSNLKPMSISALRLETRHLGRVLIVRTFGDPVRRSSVQNGVEDVNGDVELLTVHNTDSATDVTSILPKDTVFAIKEPLYKADSGNSFVVRVHHPSDLVALPPSHPLAPVEFALGLLELDKDATKYKDDGNSAFKAKEYLSAWEAYTQGLEVCGESDDSLRRDLYRNRSLVNTYLEYFEDAFEDACSALIPGTIDDETTVKNNAKALYRAGRALYCLEKFEAAQVQFKCLLQISPEDKDGLEQLRRTEARLEESMTGKYDITAMSESCNGGPTCFDCASFTTNVEIRMIEKKGRGLFATKDIKAGEVVLVEKAFHVALEPKIDAGTHVTVDLDKNNAFIGAQATVVHGLLKKMTRNPKQALRVLDLYDGGYSPKCKAEIVDGKTVIDTFQLAAIAQHNCFNCGGTSDEMDATESTNPVPASVGLWITASYFNHACNANAESAFIGDCMFVRATKGISKDEEIFLSYRIPELDYTENQLRLKKIWKFVCDCKMCAAEQKTHAADGQARQDFIKELTTFLEKYQLSFQYSQDRAVITTAEKLYKDLEATYDKKGFEDLPRLALAELNKWLWGAYTSPLNMHKILPTAMKCLRESGYNVKVVGQSLHIDRTHCVISQTPIDAAICAMHLYKAAGKKSLGKQFEVFARELYLTKYGELREFEEMAGESNAYW